MAPSWHYYHLIQLEKASTDAVNGRWHLLPDARHAGGGGGEIAEWATDDLRFYRLSDSARVLIAGVRSDLTLEAAAERIAERLGNVEIIETYAQMDVRQLAAERERLAEVLLDPDAPQDFFERVALIDRRKVDESNLIARQLAKVEEELRKKMAPPG